MWSASESGMGFRGTVCLAPCACRNETADKHNRAKVATRNERRKRRLAMENSLTCQYREQIRPTQCKSTGASHLWTTLGKTRVRTDILTYPGPVQSAFRDSLLLKCAVILKIFAVILNKVKDLCACAINCISPSLCSVRQDRPSLAHCSRHALF